MSEEKVSKRRFTVGAIVKWSVTAVVLFAALVVAARWLAWRMGHVVTDAGFVKAHVVEVAPEVPAKVLKVLVKEGDLVQAGQPLVELDDTDYSQREQMAAADVRTLAAQKELAAAKLALASGDVPAQIRAAEAAVAAAKQQREQAAANETYLAAQHRRLSALLEQKAIGRAKFDEIDAAYKAARAASEAAEAQIRAAEAKLAEAHASQAKIAEAAAGEKQAGEALSKAEEGLKLARTTLGKTKLLAPRNGVVARKFVEPGDFVSPGRPVVALYDPADMYVEARFEETKLPHVRVGQRVELTFDALGGAARHGKVRLIHRASAGEFALIPRDVTAGEFTKLTQRVPVEIDFDGDVPRDQLVPGMSVEVAARREGRDEE